jgi:dimethylsulfone monooxygenase
MSQRNPGIVGGNAFKLAMFGSNCSGGVAFVNIPERWDASWENNLQLAQLSEKVGIECIIPVARWKGFGGITDPSAFTLETLTWACGLLAHTRRLNVFGTVHVPLVHPVYAAKQMATADHVGRGRFGLNIVCGYNQEAKRTRRPLRTGSGMVGYRQEAVGPARRLTISRENSISCPESLDYPAPGAARIRPS